ncbi:hypothetical protein EDC01DRAFT_725067 [Geopyxis carbonaria]|nr:hypothetical protein EDC01DRAFT_725067 [Geopyxis carbonaria]
MLPINLLLLCLPFALGAPAAAPAPAPAAAIPWLGLKGLRPYRNDPYPDTGLPPPVELGDSAYIGPQRPQQQQQQQTGEKSKPDKQEKNTNDVFRVSEGNSIALFNGVPVDLGSGSALKITNFNDNPPALQKRALRSKLGLDFLNDPDLDETIVKTHLRDPTVGAMYVPDRRKGAMPLEMPGLERPERPQYPERPTPEKEVAFEPEEPEDEKANKKAAKEIQSGWGSNSFMVYNGTPMKVKANTKPTEKVLEVLWTPSKPKASEKAEDFEDFEDDEDFEDESAPLRKRDVHDKLGLGMFDVPDARSTRRKNPEAHPTPSPLPEPFPEPSLLEDDEIKMQNAVNKAHSKLEEPEELSLADLSNGKQFVIYNGVPIEIDGSAVRNKKLKKPRPAFRGKSDSDDFDFEFRGLHKRSPGRRFPGVDPFNRNPLTTPQPAQKPGVSTKDTTAGETSSETVVGSAAELVFPFSRETEFVSINKGNDFVMCNGQPCPRGSSGFGPF